MLPTIRLGSISLSTYWLVMAVGFLGMVWLSLRRRERYELGAGKAVIFAVLVMAAGLLGCKLLFILEHWRDVMQNGIPGGGFSFFGAVFLVAPLMALFGLLLRMKPRVSVNAAAPCVTLMIAVMRVGCFLNGCCGGWECTIGSVSFPWPTQLMESIGDAAILLWLLSVEGKDKEEPLYPRFMLAYSVLRFLVEFLRDTEKDWLYLSHGQWFSIGAALLGGLWLWLYGAAKRNKRRGTNEKEPE